MYWISSLFRLIRLITIIDLNGNQKADSLIDGGMVWRRWILLPFQGPSKLVPIKLNLERNNWKCCEECGFQLYWEDMVFWFYSLKWALQFLWRNELELLDVLFQIDISLWEIDMVVNLRTTIYRGYLWPSFFSDPAIQAVKGTSSNKNFWIWYGWYKGSFHGVIKSARLHLGGWLLS